MADIEHTPDRAPAKVAGFVVGALLCLLFTWLLSVLASVSMGSTVTIVVLVLFLAWTAIALTDATSGPDVAAAEHEE